MMSDRHVYGYTVVEIDDEAHTVTTTFGDDVQLVAANRDDQADLAAELGYGSVWGMNAEHDLTHTILAYRLLNTHSPTLWAVAHGEEIDPELRAAEEALVLAAQRFVNLYRKG